MNDLYIFGIILGTFFLSLGIFKVFLPFIQLLPLDYMLLAPLKLLFFIVVWFSLNILVAFFIRVRE